MTAQPLQGSDEALTAGVGEESRALGLLLALDRRRLRAAARTSPLGAWIGVGAPVLLAAGALWAAGESAAPAVEDASGAAAMGLLLGAPPALVGYGILFRGDDAGLLRRLGLPPRALFLERAGRLLMLQAGIAALLLLPFASAGRPLAEPLAVVVGAGIAAWAAGVASLAGAAAAMARHRPGASWGILSAGMWDRDLRAAAPLVHAPLLPMLTGFGAGAAVGAGEGAGWARAAGLVLLAALLVSRAANRYRAALPRFGPQALEMSFTPAAEADATGLRVGGGIARLLPRRSAAVWARDARVGGRRYAWAGRMVWPVAVVAFFALARWGRQPDTRTWVAAAAVSVWLAQAGAVVALGRLERPRLRGLDRAAGIAPLERLLGRWAWAWGLGLWLAIPLALAWSFWATGPGWMWLAVAGSVAAVAALASTAAAGWR